MRQLFMVILLGLAFFHHKASAETVNCTNITSLPAVISSQGVYCLKQNLSTGIGTGSAIEIRTSNVTIDCNGYKVGGLAAGVETQALGIYAFQQSNITVRNCNVRGFMIGILMSYNATESPVAPTGHVIEDNRIDNSTRAGIIVGGDSSVVRDNMVIGTGGNPYGENAIGIEANFGVDIIDNVVDEVFDLSESPKQAYGILAWKGNGNLISGNRIRGLVSAVGAKGIVTTFDSLRLSLRDNVIVNGAGPGWGIECISSTVIATGNHTNGFLGGVSHYCATSAAAPNVSIN